ncbi:hypothetical protein [Persicobacter psychrovividus]|uniref:hypothetical protein n=1 Tax=Persicobacter psychrovividus TaxID=387638 RepID=UPI0030CA2F56
MKKIFNKTASERFTKNYLRIYANIDKVEYSDQEKSELINALKSIADEFYQKPKLAFDIRGSGYGISKGDETLGIKAFTNRLSQKGLSNLDGVSVQIKDKNYYSSFSIMTNEYQTLKRVDIEFNWQHEGEESLSFFNNILRSIVDVVSIEYAYCYPDNETLSESGEWRVKTTPLSITSYQTDSEKLWNSSMEQIKDGKIKKLYPINIFNERQKTSMEWLKREMEILMLTDSIEIWKSPKLFREGIKVKNAIIY